LRAFCSRIVEYGVILSREGWSEPFCQERVGCGLILFREMGVKHFVTGLKEGGILFEEVGSLSRKGGNEPFCQRRWEGRALCFRRAGYGGVIFIQEGWE
jgi:hypothetical protein